ncbi:hypothetical protein [Arthrobacter sp. H16F315]|nr:hypothetical protein [Arthrobacter sp. H16F315]MDD1477838.1 hypothetical protein [Arthrobacter sp. H16F315]
MTGGSAQSAGAAMVDRMTESFGLSFLAAVDAVERSAVVWRG